MIPFFPRESRADPFFGGPFELGAEAQATALIAAVRVSANTGGSSATASGGKNNAKIENTGYNFGMATFTITLGGLMYEATVGGQKFTFTGR